MPASRATPLRATLSHSAPCSSFVRHPAARYIAHVTRTSNQQTRRMTVASAPTRTLGIAQARERRLIAEEAQRQAQEQVARPRKRLPSKMTWKGKPPGAFTPEERQELFERLFEAMAGGQTLAATARELAVPEATIRRWIQRDAAVMEEYRRAKQLLGQAFAEQALAIALDTTVAKFQADRLKVDTLKWLAARANPEEYGERTMHEQTGEVVVKVQVVEEQVPTRQVMYPAAQTLQIGATAHPTPSSEVIAAPYEITDAQPEQIS